MKRSYYIMNEMELQRRENTLKLIPINDDGTEGRPRYVPVENVDNIYVFGSLNMNSALLNFLGKSAIALHFFDYYGHYTGSFMAKEYLLAGKVVLEQTKYYNSKKKRITIARKIIEAAAYNILKNLKYYHNRGKDLEEHILAVETLSYNIETASGIEELMGIEGNIRSEYYRGFDKIINEFEMGSRTKQPPNNEINTLISFGNSLCYAACLSQIYHTQLNPTISFLHQPGFRRYSLALDISEIFKPILVDRLIFKVLNKKIIKSTDFEKELASCKLKDGARKNFIRSYEEKMTDTIKHRKLNRKVSYKHLIRLELYKLQKHILNIEEYKPLKMWW